MMKSTERHSSRVNLEVTTQTTQHIGNQDNPWLRVPALSILTHCGMAVVVMVVLSWVVVTGFLGLAGAGAPGASVVDVLSAGTRVWLAAHGTGFLVNKTTVTLVPLGLTGILWLLLALASAITYKNVWAAGVHKDAPKLQWQVVSMMCGCYAVVTTVISSFFNGGSMAWRAALGGLAVGFTAAWMGVHYGIRDNRPVINERIRAVGRGVAVTLLLILTGACAALVAALIAHARQISDIEAGLGFTAPVSFVLGVIYLAYLPNFLVWSSSYLIGAGVTLGMDTIVTPFEAQVGTLPAISILGVVTEDVTLLALLWIVFAAVASIAGGLFTIRTWPGRLTYEQGMTHSALVPVVALAVLVILGWLSSGDLGSNRMSDFGPRLLMLSALGLGFMVMPSAVAGVLAVSWQDRKLDRTKADPDEPATSDELTAHSTGLPTGEPDADVDTTGVLAAEFTLTKLTLLHPWASNRPRMKQLLIRTSTSQTATPRPSLVPRPFIFLTRADHWTISALRMRAIHRT